MDVHTFSSKLADFEKTFLELTWTEGRNPECPWDGGHFAIPGTPRPLSVSQVESRFLANFAAMIGAKTVLEIGTAFGYSSAWLAFGISHVHKGSLVITVDDRSEGDDAPEIFALAERLWRHCGLEGVIQSVEGHSPEVFERLELNPIDLAFIDGEHRGGQPKKDYVAVSRLLSNEGVIVFHDAQDKYDVDEALKLAAGDGYQLIPLNTSCEPVVAVRAEAQATLVLAALEMSKRQLLIGEDEWEQQS